MKKHSLFAAIFAIVLCAVMLVAPLSVGVSAASTPAASSADDPYIISAVPYDTGTLTITGEAKTSGDVTTYSFSQLYFQYTADKAGQLTVTVTGDAYAYVTVNGEQVSTAAAAVEQGDVVLIELNPYSAYTDTAECSMKVDLIDFPAGSRQNPIELDFDSLESGYTMDLSEETVWYQLTVPEDGVLQFDSADIQWGFYLAVNASQEEDSSATVLTHYRPSGTWKVKAGETILLCAQRIAADYDDNSFTVKVKYVPPFTIDEATQKIMFSGTYEVKQNDVQIFGVEFDYDNGTVSAVDLRNGVLLGTYNFYYNTNNGALELTNAIGESAPYAIEVIEDPESEYGAYLRLNYNVANYKLEVFTGEMTMSSAIKELLNGKYELWAFGALRETYIFTCTTDADTDEVTVTATIAKNWSTEGTVYTMKSYSVFSGNLVLTAEGKTDVTLVVTDGKIMKGNYTLTVLELIHVCDFTYDIVVTAPTCTENGYTTYTCSCGEFYIGDEIATSGHEYESVVTAPTCTEGGYTANTCLYCGDETVTDETAATGHTYESVVTAPACTEGGYTTNTCVNCGDQTRTDETAAAGHKYVATVTKPTCTEGGYTTHVCSVCNDTYQDSETAATGHIFGDWYVETAPGCTTEGQQRRDCSGCDLFEVKSVAAAGHSWDDGVVTKEPTETATGEKKFACTACGETKTEKIPELGHEHSYTAVVTAPSCTEQGYTTHSCTCGDSYKDTYVKQLGHSYTAVVTAPTCTAQGYTTHTCAACGDSYVADYVVSQGHSYQAIVTEATCLTDGYTTHTCAACGDSYTDGLVVAAGHSYDDGRETDGVIVYTCAVCGSSYSVEVGTEEFTVPGYLTGTVNGTQDYTWTVTEDGFLKIDNVGSLSGAYTTVTINGESASATENGYAVVVGDVVVITVETFSEVQINIPVYMYDESAAGSESPMEFTVEFEGWNLYEQTWVAPFSGTLSFVITESNVDAANLTFRVIDANGNMYNQYEFGLDENGCQYVTLEVTEGDKLTLVAYEDSYSVAGRLTVKAMEGQPAPHEHSYGEGVVTAPTCTSDGYTTYICTVCGESCQEDIVPAAHSYESVVTAPTCTADGYTTYTCTACGDTYAEDGDKALDHSYGDWEVVKEATTTETGTRKRVCATCGQEQTEEIPVIEEQPTTIPAAPTDPEQPVTTAPAAPATTGGDSTGDDDTGSSTIVIVVIAAVVLAGGAAAAVLVIKKKK